MNIVRTEFTDYGKLNYSYGFRAYDDQEQTYSDLMERVDLDKSPSDFLHTIVNNYADATFTRLFDWALHHTKFIVIDDIGYAIEVNTDDTWELLEKN